MKAIAAGAIALAVTTGCGSKPAAPPAPPPVPLHLAPACDLVPGAGLAWLVDVKPRALTQEPELIPVIGAVVPEARFRAYAEAHGGVDPRQVQEVCVGRFKASTLVSAHVPIDPAKVEASFTERSAAPPTRTLVVANPPVVRLDGEVLGEPQHLTIFGREHVAFETGKLSSLRAAEAFALGRLKRSSPALATKALAPVATALGDAPVRVFVPGPFEGELASGLGGLLRATTAVGLSARAAGAGGRISVRVVLAGAWGEDAEPARERLAAAAHVLSETALGRMLGVNRPLEGPTARVASDAIVLDATYDGMRIAEGAHDVLEGDIAQMLRR